jgi:hypothetical protein
MKSACQVILIEREDYEFLLLSGKFCSKIDRYLELLDLGWERIQTFKNDNRELVHVFNNSKQFQSCIESFKRFKIKNMRRDFLSLVQSCKQSKNYTSDIGLDLGIEVPIYTFQPN